MAEWSKAPISGGGLVAGSSGQRIFQIFFFQNFFSDFFFFFQIFFSRFFFNTNFIVYPKNQVFRSFFLGDVRKILHFGWVYANLASVAS